MTASSKYRNIYTRFIPREEVGHATLVDFGSVNRGDIPVLPVEEPKTPEQLKEEETRRIAQEEQDRQEEEFLILKHQQEIQEARERASTQAYAQGIEQGRSEATLEWQQRFDEYVTGQGQELAQRLACVAQTMQNDLQAMQQHMAQDILLLSCDIARQVVRQELHINPHALMPVVREALDMLVTDTRPTTVRLNPQDHAVIAQAMRTESTTPAIQWVADTAIAEGGCLIESAGTVIDGSLEKRWQRAIAPLAQVSAWQGEDASHAD